MAYQSEAALEQQFKVKEERMWILCTAKSGF